MSKLVFADIDFFKKAMKSISVLLLEATIELDQEGMRIKSMDPANVAMVDFYIRADTFPEYDVKEEGEKHTFKVETLLAFLKRANAKDIVTLEFDEKMHVKIKSENNKEFGTTLIGIEPDKTPDTVKLDFDFETTMPTEQFNSVCNDIATMGDSVVLVGDKERIVMRAESDKMVDSFGEIKLSADNKVKMKEGVEAAKVKLSSEYINKIVDSIKKITENVKIQFGNDYPILLTYSMADRASISFLVAPRVDNEG